MKIRLFSFMASALMAPTMGTAQVTQDTDSATERMSDILLQGNREVKAQEPFAAKCWLPFGPDCVNYASDSDITTELHSSATGTNTKTDGNTISTDVDYVYTISKGVTGKPNEVGVIYYGFFSKTQFQIVKYDSSTKMVTKSAVMNYGTDEMCDFTNGSFLGYLRRRTVAKMDLDMITKYVANDTRRNEIFQSFVDLNTLDYDNDGTNDLMLMLGTTLYIINGQDLKVMDKHRWCDWNEISPSSVVYDFNGDGINDYFWMSTFCPKYDFQDHSCVEGGLLLSSRDADGRVSFNSSKKTMDIKHVTSLENRCTRTAMTMRLIYPEGKNKAPKLAIATSDVARGPWVNKCYPFIYIEQQLTIMDLSAEKLCTTENLWYTPATHERRRFVAQEIKETSWWTTAYIRQRPYLFGRPALCAAFSQGYDKPQRILWIDKIMSYDNDSKTLNDEFSLADKHNALYGDDDLGHFDRIIGGQVEAITGTTADEAQRGVESFAMIVAGTKESFMTYTSWDFFDWVDVGYYVTNVSPDPKADGQWTYGLRPNSISGFKPKTLTKTNQSKGIQVELTDKCAMTTTPIIQQVISAVPYQSYNMMTPGTTLVRYTPTGGANTSLGKASSFASISSSAVLNASAHLAAYPIWNDTISTPEGMYASNSNGEDYVTFSYFPFDRFTYRVTACPSVPEMINTRLYMTKAQGSSMQTGQMAVSEFNNMVSGTACPQITDEVLHHTAGDINSYASGSGDNESVMKAFGIDESSCMAISDDIERYTNDMGEMVNVRFGYGTPRNYESTFDVESPVLFADDYNILNNSPAGCWTQTNSWNKAYTATCILPMAIDWSRGQCSYRMVWYKHTANDTEGNPLQSFMVVNYYVTSCSPMLEASADSSDATGINGINKDKTVKSVKYFDNAGREIAQPTHGMYMKVTTYTDGSHDSKKLMAR